jgi:hypothetical protein
MRDAAIRQAVERANRERGASIRVSKLGERWYVNSAADEIQPPSGAEIVCIAQFWSVRESAYGGTVTTIQVRFSGAHSEFITL